MSKMMMRKPAARVSRGLFWASVAGACLATLPALAFAGTTGLQLAQAATPNQPPPAVEPKPDASLGTPATVIDGQSAESLLGKKVQSAKGEDLGRIVDVIVDKAGQIRAAIVDFGGFLGVGSRKIAVDWRAIHMTDDGKLDHLVVSLPQDQLRSAPAYKEGEPVVVIGPPSEQPRTPLPGQAVGGDPAPK